MPGLAELQVIAKVSDFSTQNLANTAWAYAKLGSPKRFDLQHSAFERKLHSRRLGLWNERLMQTWRTEFGLFVARDRSPCPDQGYARD